MSGPVAIDATYWFSATLAGLARDLGLPPTSSLSELHRAVCAAFDWPAGDAHRLLLGGRVYSGPGVGDASAGTACTTALGAVLRPGDVAVHQPDGDASRWALMLEVTQVGGRRPTAVDLRRGSRHRPSPWVPAQSRGPRGVRPA